LEIAPSPGVLKHINAVLPHPNGVIEAVLKFEGRNVTGVITLPKGASGIFKFAGKKQKIKAGRNKINI
jgi:hypothetical protein